MSKKESSPKEGDQAPDLSALDFGPAWAKKDQKQKTHRSQPGSKSGSTGDTGGAGNSDGRGEHGGRRRTSQGGGGQRNERSSDRRGDQRGDRRDHRGKNSGGSSGGDRRDFNKGDRNRKPHTPMAPPAEGVTSRIMPIEEGMDAMAKQISATGRTHSVFELAWVVLGGMDRFHVIFESEEQPIYKSKSDHSVWLSQKECMAHFWSAGLNKKYYEEEIVEVEAPAGNFQSVARCGFSGKLIGPPNHHAYQQTLLNLHRERFSNMALDRYKSKVVMDHSEEAVQEWVDGMRKQLRWRPASEVSDVVEVAEATEVPVDVSSEEVSPEEEQTEISADSLSEGEEEVVAADAQVAEVEDVESDSVPAPTPDSVAEKAETPVIEETVIILNNHREVEQHFLGHGFEQEFEINKLSSALANIPPHMISPGLMTVLKNTAAEEKRYPGKLASILCRQMSGRHLAVFKWKKRLHCGPARPKHVPDDMVIADRPSALFKWVLGKPGGNIDEMWKDCLPSDVDDAARHLWYHDLHWLINEGLVLLFSDGTLHAAKELGKPPTNQPSKTAKKKKPAKKKPAEGKPELVKPTEEKSDDQPVKETSAKEIPAEEAPDEASLPDKPPLEE